MKRALWTPALLLSMVAAAPIAHRAAVRTESAHRAPISIVVDLSDRELTVRRDGEVQRTFSVAVGSPEHQTPTGKYAVRHLIWNPRWVPPDAKWAKGLRAREPGDPRNPMGRVKLFVVEPDIYIHGTHDEDSLGQAESHGCIRMRNREVIDLAKIVMENGGAQRSPSWFRRIVNRVTHTQEVHLDDAVPVTIQE